MVDTAPRTSESARADERASSSPTKGAAPGASVDTAPAPKLDVALVERMLRGSYPDVRLEAREVAKDPQFHKVEGLTLDEQRERTLEQMKVQAERGFQLRAFPKRLGGYEDAGGNLAAFEELVTADPSLQIKGGVQWGLFAAAVLHLGTEKHHDKFLPDAISLKVPGAFAMTETGHGSDVASIATTATYDPETEEFVIHTPFRAAWKDYLGNAAKHATAATVFAQLITKGVNHGVHCFYVPIRDAATGEFLPGIGGEDDGHKGGLNGVDNGRLHFDHVRVPRENLLNRYGDVSPDGTYSSPIDSPGRRFFTMLGTLVQGRVSLDGSTTIASALGLYIALTYASQRRQFVAGNPDEEQVILDYQRHQRRLLPRLAQTYAQYFSHDVLLSKFDDVFSGRADTDENRQDLETLAAALKPLSTWHALDTLQEAREACGGSGFLAENRLVGLRADLDIYVTFEGDNNVLLQLVGKRLLTDYAKRFKGASAADLAKFAAGQVVGKAYNEGGLRRVGQNLADLAGVGHSIEALKDHETQRALLTDRVETMVAGIAAELNKVRRAPAAEQAAAFNTQQNELIEASRAWGELQQWEAFTAALDTVTDAGTREVLGWVHSLFTFGLFEKHLSWYLIHGRITGRRGAAVTAYINRLLERLRPHTLDLIAAFGFAPEHVRAPIASGAEGARQEEARAYYAELRASGQAPVEEKALKKKAKQRG
ncbi:acyl-CoA dehydrogenase family protein [Gryllotalpicola ginsengisoli]|uniref:acyl-CoA dehydrogenase family protein n=1 Tax=Gryllotalpicola ginsengisoli TaxID=444608 RepID=UPI0003B702FC|nr:acyl-CoA dehydrogenase [Gryllotalpicola ginsengisoli]